MSEMRPIQNGGRTPNGNGQHRQSAESRQRVERARLRERRRRRRRNITLLVCLLLILVVAACAVVAIWFISDPSGADKPAETTAVTTDAQSGTESTTAAETDPLAGPEAYGITFISDLADYEQYMDPAERDDYLILVNKTSTISASDEPTDLVDIADTRQDRATQQMRKYAAKALEALFIEMRAYGYTDVSVTSAFRSYNYQEQLFTGYVAKELKNHSGWTQAQAEAEAETYSARAGMSEHQTGLCCDMHNLSSADVSFANQEAYKWLSENAWKFGFILRFPEDKTDITGYSFEPWHYRFVGRYHAQKIHDGGLCLEEYLQTYLGTAASAQTSN